jgi:hypothetical protein
MRALATVLLTLAFLLNAQTPSNQEGRAATDPARAFSPQQLPQPAVPSDPLELVTGDAQPVQTVDQRAAATTLLLKASTLLDIRPYPYHRKTTFTSFGSTASDGAWQLEDITMAGHHYRWTAQGPGYSVINIFGDKTLYSSMPALTLPVRLSQVRSAMWFVRPMVGPRATLRTAMGSLNGVSVECILLSNFGMAQGAAGGRRWEETEYCIDQTSGSLMTYSPAPGFYVQYDYSQAFHFHDRLVPNKFIITQAGRVIIEAQTTSVSESAADPALFQTAGLNQIGVGSIMTGPSPLRTFYPSELVTEGTSHVVVLHAMQSATGQISDIEMLASSNPALNSAAVDFVSKWQTRRGPNQDVEPGATPLSYEVLVTVTFFARPKPPIQMN